MEKNYFKFAITVTWIIILLCFLSVALLIKIHFVDHNFNEKWILLPYSIPLLISSLVLVRTLYQLRHIFSKLRKDIAPDESIVTWKYSDEEWENYNLSVWKKTRNKLLEAPVVFLILFTIIGVLSRGFSSKTLASALPFIILFIFSMIGIIFYYHYGLYRRTKICPREVIIGKNGFLYGGIYYSWTRSRTDFAGVKLIPGKISILEFDIKEWSKFGYRSVPMTVPIPSGHEVEVEKIAGVLTL